MKRLPATVRVALGLEGGWRGAGGGARGILVLVSGHKQGKFQDVSGALLRSP